MTSIRCSRYSSSEGAQRCDKYINEGDFCSIMQDDGIHAIRYVLQTGLRK